jgi:hypothetical protein
VWHRHKEQIIYFFCLKDDDDDDDAHDDDGLGKPKAYIYTNKSLFEVSSHTDTITCFTPIYVYLGKAVCSDICRRLSFRAFSFLYIGIIME